MRRSAIIATAFSFIAIASANGLTISGKVSDSVSGAGISGATVVVSRPGGPAIDSTTTTATGAWTLSFTLGIMESPQPSSSPLGAIRCLPNPFAGSTRIDFIMSVPGPATITVLNSAGEMVASWTKRLAKGAYRFFWTGGPVPGVYFIKTAANGASVVMKAVQLDEGNSGGRIDPLPGARLTGTVRAPSPSPDLAITASKLGYVPKTFVKDVKDGETFRHALETVHAHAVVADLHNDVLEVLIPDPNYHLADSHTKAHTDIPRLKAGGVDLQLFAVWMDPSAANQYTQALKRIDRINGELALNPGTIAAVSNRKEADSVIALGKIGALLVAEGGNMIENDLSKLIDFYKRGIRYLTITWNASTPWAVCAQDSKSATQGLSEFGKTVIRTMDSLGMIIDVAHTGIKTIQDILTVTKNPIIDSHCGARAICNHYRNLTDDQIKAIAATGGVMGVLFYPPYLASNGQADIAKVVEHIDHFVKIGGIDHVGLGSDFDGIEATAKGLDDVSKFPALTMELLKHGYPAANVEKILGGNFLRVFKQVCGK